MIRIDEQFADIQLLRYELKGFEQLSLRQKKLIYCLAKATLAGRNITTDQFGKYNLDIRTLLEIIYQHYEGNRVSEDFHALESYLKQVWFANGIYHHYNCNKFVPQFSEKYLDEICNQLSTKILSSLNYSSLEELKTTLFPIIFDPEVLPKRVEKSPEKDLVLSSACNYYEGVNQAEVEAFYQQQRDAYLSQPDHQSNEEISYGLNTRLVKREGEIVEEPCAIGGCYSATIENIVRWLQRAANYTENEQQQRCIQLLVDYYTTGDLKTFDEYSIEWVKDTESVIDFINGFIEVYGDPLGLKGSWEGIVHYVDVEATQRTHLIAAWAQWFEDHSPVDAAHKKAEVKGISARVVNAAMLGGDEYPSTAIGINLPNSDWIRAEYGSKSITISNITHAYHEAAKGNGFLEEFVPDEQMRQLIRQYDEVTDHLHTDLHECVGHGSGQLLTGVASDALKAYADTIEEARADLFALYYLADVKLVELGLTPDTEAYKAEYYTYLMNGAFTQFTRLKQGEQIEEAHMRNRALIARWTLEHYPEAAHLSKQEGKTVLQVQDFPALRQAFATLLKEVQRIKSEGDLVAAKQLVEDYGVKVNPDLHQEVLQRYQTLGIKPYKGFLNPHLIPVKNAEGDIIDIRVDYSEGYAEQMLRYSKEYAFKEQHPAQNVEDVQLQAQLTKIKHIYRQHMNGVGAASMHQKGINYKLNYGIPFTEIQAIAQEFQPDKHLAEALYAEDIRESKLLALLLMPTGSFNTHDADRWIQQAKTVEVVEYAAKWLFPLLPNAFEWALNHLRCSGNLYLLAAIDTLCNLLRTNQSLALPASDRETLLLTANNLSLPFHLRRAAHNLYLAADNR